MDSVSALKNIDKVSLILVFDHDKVGYDDEIAFAKKHMRTFPIFLDKNVGPGLARQAGLVNSSSKYVMFADADDYFLPKALDEILSKLPDFDGDILSSTFRYERDGEIKIIQNNMAWLHGKVYRRAFLVEHNVHFGDFRSNEDNGFNRLALFYKPRRKIIRVISYVYSENPKSITRRNDRAYKYYGLEYLAKSHVWAAREYLRDYDNCDYVEIASAMLSILLSMYYYYLDYFEIFDVEKIILWSKEAFLLYSEYSSYLSDSLKDNYIDAYNKEYPKTNKRTSFDEFLAKIGDIDD